MKLKKKASYSQVTLPLLKLGMAILPRLTWSTPSRFTPRKFFLPHKGGGAGMGGDFSLAPPGRAGMDLDFLDSPRPAPIPTSLRVGKS